MKIDPKRAGIGLIEMMIVSVIMALVMSVLAALFGAIFRSEGRMLSSNVTENGAAMMGRALRQTLPAATYIQVPAVDPNLNATPAPNSVLAWANTNPEDGTAIDPGSNRSFTFFCLKAHSDRDEFLMFQQNNYAGGWPMPNPTCDNPPAGTSPFTLTGNVPGLQVAPSFRRPNGSMLLVDYTVTLAMPGRPPQQTSYSTVVGLPGGL